MIKYKLSLFRPILPDGYVFKFKNKIYYLIRFIYESKYSLLIDFYNEIILYNSILYEFKKYIKFKCNLNDKSIIAGTMPASIQYDILKRMFEDIIYVVENHTHER